MKRVSISKRIALAVLAILIIVVCVGPVLFVYWNASKSPLEYDISKFAPPRDFSYFLQNVNSLIKSGLLKWILNTLIVVVISVLLSAIFTSMSGYAFAKLRLPGKTFVYWLVISLLAMPTQVFLIPIFVMFSNLNLTDNLYSLALIYSGFSYAFGTFLMTSFYKGIPDEIIESAKIDGANKFQVFLKIMLPLGKPAIITLIVLDFFGNWNELLIALVFNSSSKAKLLTPGIAIFQQVAKAGAKLTNWPLIYTGIVLSLIIPFIVYFVFQNRIAAGITVGAVKE
jgi:ABC-type glycerol-3-phosphate transport system permease component